MQINLNPTSERGASRDAVNRPRETLGDSHLISSDPRSRFGLVCDLLCCRGNTISVEQRLALPGVEDHATGHGCKYQVRELSWSTQLYRPRPLSLLRGAI